MMTETLAIYGGTFSPPHIGHIRAAEAFYDAIRPSRLLVMPSATPPHKAPVAGADDEARLAMCRLAFSHIPHTEVSDLEIARQGKSYTVYTLRALAAPGRSLCMLVGTDMFLTLDSWYMSREIFALSEIAVMRRESDPGKTALLKKQEKRLTEEFCARVRFIDADVTEISSSDLRARITAGLPTEGYLTEEVEAYIRKCHLYQA